MPDIRAQAIRWISDDFPGFVECRFSDVWGITHLVHEKVPVVTTLSVDARTLLPVDVLLACELISVRVEGACAVVTVTTEKPWAIDSTAGLSRFELAPDQLGEDE